jgi:hypothetical protein
VSTNNEYHRHAMLSSLLPLPSSYAQISPSAPYELPKTLGLCYYLNMRDQVSHPHTKTGTVVILHMSIANEKTEYPGPNGNRRIVSSFKSYERMPDVAATNTDYCNWYHSCRLKPLHMTSQCGWCCRVTSWIVSGERNWRHESVSQ